jgi:hypothetical protein
MKMSTSYEQEQKNLELTIAECEQALREADKAKVDLRMLLKGLREFTELKELTPEIVNTLIQRTSIGDSFPLVRFSDVALTKLNPFREIDPKFREIRRKDFVYRRSDVIRIAAEY